MHNKSMEGRPLTERFEPGQISRNSMVIEVSTDDLLQPSPVSSIG
jgi:hypothetical protein